MRDVLDALHTRWRAGETVGLATVVHTWRSAPRPPGAAMFVAADGTVVGSVSGGCVEGAAYDLAVQARDTGSAHLQRYGVSDDAAFAVGLSCGGQIELFVERFCRDTFAEFPALVDAVGLSRPVALATVLAGPRAGNHLVVTAGETFGSLGSARLDDAVRDDALGVLAHGAAAVVRYGADGERRGDDLPVFVNSFAPRPRMIVFGAIDFAAAVARLGTFLDYRVTVCDARPTFATAERFPDVDEVVVDWPHRYLARTEVGPDTVLCVLTHDPKFDVPVLAEAVRLPVAYIGAMGSRRTHAERMAALRELGLDDAQLARIRGPIGLDIGSRTPAETAVSIAAEIIAVRWGGSGASLRDTGGTIHRDAPG